MRSAVLVVAVVLVVVVGAVDDAVDGRAHPIRSPVQSSVDPGSTENTLNDDGAPVTSVDPVDDESLGLQKLFKEVEEKPVGPPTREEEKKIVEGSRRRYEVQSDAPITRRFTRLRQCKGFDLSLFNTLFHKKSKQVLAQSAACSFCMAMQMAPKRKRNCKYLFSTPPKIFKTLCEDMNRPSVGDFDSKETPMTEDEAFTACTELACCNYLVEDDHVDDRECEPYSRTNTRSQVHSTCENCVAAKAAHMLPIRYLGEVITPHQMARLIARAQCMHKGCCHPHTDLVPLADVRYKETLPALKLNPMMEVLKSGAPFRLPIAGGMTWGLETCVECRRLSLHKLQHYFTTNFRPLFEFPADEVKMGKYKGEMISGCVDASRSCAMIQARMERFLRLHGNELDMLLMGPDWMCSALSQGYCDKNNKEYRNDPYVHNVLQSHVLESPNSISVRQGKSVSGMYDESSFCVPLDGGEKTKARDIQHQQMTLYPNTLGMCRDVFGHSADGMSIEEYEKSQKIEKCKAQAKCFEKIAEQSDDDEHKLTPEDCKRQTNLSFHSWRDANFAASPALRHAWSNEMVCQVRTFLRDFEIDDALDYLDNFFNMGIWGPLEATLHGYEKLVRAGVPDFQYSPEASANLYFRQEENNLKANQCAYPYYLDRLSHLYVFYTWLVRKAELGSRESFQEVLANVKNVCCNENNRLKAFNIEEDEDCVEYVKRRRELKAMDAEKAKTEAQEDGDDGGKAVESTSTVMEAPLPLGDDGDALEKQVGPVVDGVVGPGEDE